MRSLPRRVDRAVMVLMLAGAAGTAQAQQPARLSLGEAVQRALATSPSVEAGRGSLAVAAGSRKEIQSERLPDAGLGGAVWRYSDPMIYRPIHEFSAEAFPGFDRTLIQGEFQVGWTIFDGWIRSRRLDQARALEGSASDQLSGREQDVVAQTVQAYVESITARDVLAAQEKRKAALHAEASRVEQFLAEGRAARVEQLRASAALGGAEADRSTAAARLAFAEASLARLTGLDREAVRADRLEEVRPGAQGVPARDSLLAVLRQGKVSTNVYLQKIHNFALDMNWLPASVIPKRQWPAIKFKVKRAITVEEHGRIIEASARGDAARSPRGCAWRS